MDIKQKQLIKLKPDKWTKHHTHRVLHVSGLLASLAIVISSAWVFGSKIADIRAGDVSQATGVGVHVAEISEGPTTVANTNAGGFSPNYSGNDNSESSLPPSQPGIQAPTATVTAASTSTQTVAKQTSKINGVNQVLYVINTQYPEFSGHTNIPNALIHLDIHSSYTITSNVYANSSGDWTWKSVTPVSPGNHTIIITASDESQSQVSAKISMYFLVKLDSNAVVALPTTNNTVEKGNGGTLFDVIVAIPQQFKTVNSKGEIVAKVKFVNFGSSGHPVDVESQYTIRNSKGEVVMQSSQTVAVATQLSIIKTFYPNPNMAAGTYTLTVSVPSQDLVATASDTFELKSAAATRDSENTTNSSIDYSIIFQILTGMILLFSLVAYLEYNKVEMLSATIKHITEKDLISEI